MGILNVHPVYCSVMDKVKTEWNELFVERHSNKWDLASVVRIANNDLRTSADSEVIVDDLFLHSSDSDCLLAYFTCVLATCQKYCITVNLKKCRFFPEQAEFVGIDITGQGNQPASSKFKAFRELGELVPTSIGQIRKIIGFIGFYQEWLPFYEVRVDKWRTYIATADDDENTIKTLWTEQDTDLLKQFIEEILAKPTLARPNYNRRFYVKTDWSKHGLGMAISQADPNDPEALKAELAEDKGGPCLRNSRPPHCTSVQ